MESKAVARTGSRRQANSPAPALGVIALAGWAALATIIAFLSGAFSHITRHDLLIALIAVSFVLMACASVFLVREDLRSLSRLDRPAPRRTRR